MAFQKFLEVIGIADHAKKTPLIWSAFYVVMKVES